MPSTPLVDALRARLDAGEIAGAALRFRRGDELVESADIGFADIAAAAPIERGSIFRQASLTKPVIAVAVLQLIESGAIGLDDPIAAHLPAFAGTSVDAGAPPDWQDAGEADRAIRIVPAARPATIRDLLTHSSGLGQGPRSAAILAEVCTESQTLAERVDVYAAIPGDAQPGQSAGYSPQIGFDILGRIIEVRTGADLNSAVRASILDPLGMQDTAFELDDEQQRRLVRLYRLDDGALHDDSAMPAATGMLVNRAGLHSGAAGLLGTADDFDRFARMLARGGELDGIRILDPSTAAMLAAERGSGARLFQPRREWGLGVIVAVQGSADRALGAWGWSGAWGSHLVVDPANGTTLVLMINRSDIGGADSPISAELERIAVRMRRGAA